MGRQGAEEGELTPLARLVDDTVTGVEPGFMGIGPVSAVRRLLQRTGLTIDQIDVFEVNEAFAAQALAVAGDLGLPSDKTNPNGSGISLRHPLSATGAILTVKTPPEVPPIRGRHPLA